MVEDYVNAALCVAFYVERHNRVVNGKTEQEPAVAVVLVKVNTDSFTVVVGNFPALLSFCVLFKVCNYLFAVLSEILLFDFETDFL